MAGGGAGPSPLIRFGTSYPQGTTFVPKAPAVSMPSGSSEGSPLSSGGLRMGSAFPSQSSGAGLHGPWGVPQVSPFLQPPAFQPAFGPPPSHFPPLRFEMDASNNSTFGCPAPAIAASSSTTKKKKKSKKNRGKDHALSDDLVEPSCPAAQSSSPRTTELGSTSAGKDDDIDIDELINCRSHTPVKLLSAAYWDDVAAQSKAWAKWSHERSYLSIRLLDAR